MRTIHDFVEGSAPRYVKGAVLDVGGGWGRWKGALERFSSSYTISDPFDDDADFKDDARKLSNPDESFDTVVCFETLEHVDDTQAVIAEMYRVLKPGGYVIATAPFMYVRHGNPSDYHRFTPAGFEFLFKQAGFEMVDSGGLGSMTTVLGCIAKAKYKHCSKRGQWWQSKFYYLLHQLCMRLPQDSDPDFFTNSYIIARKV